MVYVSLGLLLFDVVQHDFIGFSSGQGSQDTVYVNWIVFRGVLLLNSLAVMSLGAVEL